MKELEWDKQLNIQTIGRDDSEEDNYHHPYEPTPYSVLERLADSGYIEQENILIDYGCGKGRVGFYLNHRLGCQTIGIEFSEKIYAQAIENQKRYKNSQDIKFVCQSAEQYVIEDADCFFFFNPFSVEILKSVMGRILDSYYENPRVMRLFFYYPDVEYIGYLLAGNLDLVDFADEIDCLDLFDGNDEREKILVFEIGNW